jgi:hypothetical protein
MAVTNFNDCNVAMFRIQSAAAAYDITLPFQADMIEWWNNTKYATDAKNISGIWIDGLTDDVGGALIVSRGTTDLSSVLETTNGVTELSDGSGFAATGFSPTAITAASPAVVTFAGHGLTTGQFVRATNFRSTPVASATGMYALNNQTFQVVVLSSSTFALYYPYTNVPYSTVGQTAFANAGIAKFNLIGQDLDTESAAPQYQYTLGTAVMGDDNDIIFVRATKANVYTNLGDVA